MNQLSDDHKAALADGRRRARIVRRYLEALPADGRTADEVRRALEDLRRTVRATRDVLERLRLIQRRIDLQRDLARQLNSDDPDELEAEFVAVAAEYGRRNGIGRADWEALGVPADVVARMDRGPDGG